MLQEEFARELANSRTRELANSAAASLCFLPFSLFPGMRGGSRHPCQDSGCLPPPPGRRQPASLLMMVAAVVGTAVQPARGFCSAPGLRGLAAPRAPPLPPTRARGGRPRAWTLVADGTDADWRAFRAQLVQKEAGAAGGGGSQAREQVAAGGLAHEIWAPEAGCLLKFRGSQSYFARAVVLLTEHDEHAGSIGFLLNRPTPHTVGDVAPSLRLFAGCPLFSGGPVGDGLQFIHSLPDVHGSKEIMRGVFYGGALRACARASRVHVCVAELRQVTHCRGQHQGTFTTPPTSSVKRAKRERAWRRSQAPFASSSNTAAGGLTSSRRN